MEQLKDLIKIKVGRRKLIGFLFAVFVGAVIQIVTEDTTSWLWISILYGIYSGMNISSKFISFKKNNNGKIIT